MISGMLFSLVEPTNNFQDEIEAFFNTKKV